jgi:hypothetical protein
MKIKGRGKITGRRWRKRREKMEKE